MRPTSDSPQGRGSRAGSGNGDGNGGGADAGDRREAPAVRPDLTRPLSHHLDRAAAAHGACPALLREEGEALDHAGLARRSRAAAAALAAHGIARGDRIGLFAGRGEAPLIALLGVLRAGAVAVPCMPAVPFLVQAPCRTRAAP